MLGESATAIRSMWADCLAPAAQTTRLKDEATDRATDRPYFLTAPFVIIFLSRPVPYTPQQFASYRVRLIVAMIQHLTQLRTFNIVLRNETNLLHRR